MGLRTYVCNLQKALHIGLSTLGAEYRGKMVKFEDGLYTTDDPNVQALIERNDQFGSMIHWQDDVATMERRNLQTSEERANARSRERARLLQEIEEEEKVERAQADRLRKSEDNAEVRKKQKEQEEEAERRRLEKENEQQLAALSGAAPVATSQGESKPDSMVFERPIPGKKGGNK